jgi:hypothetical protein
MILRSAAWLTFIALSPWLRGGDALEIVRKTVTRDSRNWEIAKDYTFVEEHEQRSAGGAKSAAPSK